MIAGWMVAPDVGDQSSKLVEWLPVALDGLKQQLMQYGWTFRIWDSMRHLRELVSDTSSTVQYMANFSSSTLGALGDIVFALFIGMFLSKPSALR